MASSLLQGNAPTTSLSPDGSEPSTTATEDALEIRSASDWGAKIQELSSDLDIFLWLMTGIGVVIALLSILNTMLMSVLERTREIGIMKSVGASNADVQLIFLVEGALIGLIGGILGILLAWIASLPGDSWVRSMVQRDMNVQLKEALFVFPPWLVATVILFSIIVTTIAAVYPARRAARIDPVTALRHD
jgi:putative ABC transport system permease protein